MNESRYLQILTACRNRWGHLKLFDKNLVYFWTILSFLIIIFHRNIANPFAQLMFHILFIVLLLWIVPWLNARPEKIWKFIRYWYIVIALPFLYWDVGSFLHLVTGREFDPLILGLEQKLFGELPNLAIQNYVHPFLTEIMQISYSIYWITIPLGTAVFYFRKEYRSLEYLLQYISLTFIISYFFFIFIPVAGPRFFLADQLVVPYDGIFFTGILRNFMTRVGYRGGAFPSSHVGVAVVILIYVWHFKPKMAVRVFLPLVVALSLATVYGQYHYLTDVVFGLMMGFTIGFLGARKTKRLHVEGNIS